jgi:hypothetical protein
VIPITQKDNQVTTNFEFFDSSERAKTVDPDGSRPQIGVEKYPWRSLPVGKSFFINTKENTVKLQTMQSAASRWSKKLAKVFRVVKHDDGIEVARLTDNDKAVQEHLNTVGKGEDK